MQDIRVVDEHDFGAACLAALLEAARGITAPVVGLPTGNTPVALFASLRTAVERGDVAIQSWRPFAIDEYGGPSEHPCSNRSFFSRYWDQIPGAAEVQQFDPGAPDIDRECGRMSDALARAGGLDVALLGVGMNGHLAFNEPGSTLASGVRAVQLHEASRVSGAQCWGGETPTWGLTLGLQELLSARTVIVMANGAGKAAIVARAIDGPESPDCPASMVRGAPNAVWVLDVAAAALLQHPRVS